MRFSAGSRSARIQPERDQCLIEAGPDGAELAEVLHGQVLARQRPAAVGPGGDGLGGSAGNMERGGESERASCSEEAIGVPRSREPHAGRCAGACPDT